MIKSAEIRDKKFLVFQGAAATSSDDADEKTKYTPRGEICIDPMMVEAFYDHTIIIGGHKILVMDSFDMIMERIRRGK